MDSIIGLLIALSIITIGFLLLPLPYGRTGGYGEIAKVFKVERPRQVSATYQTISVERGYGFLGQFTGVNFYFNKTGFFIFPMFRVWSWTMPTIFLPYDQIKVEKIRSLGIFTKVEINFPGKTLPKLFIAGKYYSNLQYENCK